MSDEDTTPNEDLRSTVDRLQRETLNDLEEMLSNGGKRTHRFRCDACGSQNAKEVQQTDPELLVKAISMLSSVQQRLKAVDDDSTAAATKILRDRSELTDAELAEYIAKLEAELA